MDEADAAAIDAMLGEAAPPFALLAALARKDAAAVEAAAGWGTPADLARLRTARDAIADFDAATVRSDRLGWQGSRFDLVAMLSAAIRLENLGNGDLAAWLEAKSQVLAERPGGADLIGKAMAEPDATHRLRWIVSDAVFPVGLDLTELAVRQPLAFRRCRFHGPLDLSDMAVHAPVAFDDCTMLDGLLCDRVDAAPAAFDAEAGLDLGGCYIEVAFSLRHARGPIRLPRRIDGEADLGGSVLECSLDHEKQRLLAARFERTVFALPAGETAWFNLVTFERSCSFDRADIRRCSFAEARFSHASFRHALIGDFNAFSDAEFSGETTFDGASLQCDRSPRDLWPTRLVTTRPISLRDLRVEGPLWISIHARADVAIDLSGSRFGSRTVFETVGPGGVRFVLAGAAFHGTVELRLPPGSVADMAGATFAEPPVYLQPTHRRLE